MNAAFEAIKADLQRHTRNGLSLDAYDRLEAECALEEAGIDPDELGFSPAAIIRAVYIARCEDYLAYIEGRAA